MGPWMAKLMVAELVDIHNLKVLLAVKAPKNFKGCMFGHLYISLHVLFLETVTPM